MALIPLISSKVIPLKIIPSSVFISSRLLPRNKSTLGEHCRHFARNNKNNKIIFRSLFTSFAKSILRKSSVVSVTNLKYGYGNLFKNFRSSPYYTAKCKVHSSSQPESSPGPENKDKERWLPSIMPFPPVMWPRFVNSVRNWFFVHFVIKPYFDRGFDLSEFDRGARQAVSFVSNKLSSGEFGDLEGVVDASALEEIKKSVSTFSLFQRDLIKVAVEDVFFSFPYQIGIIIPDQPTETGHYLEGASKPPQVRHVEITVVMHVLRGYSEKQKAEESRSFVEFIQDDSTKYNVMVCNYRFFRDFTEGVKNPSWIINMVNHFLPADIQRIQKRQ